MTFYIEYYRGFDEVTVVIEFFFFAGVDVGTEDWSFYILQEWDKFVDAVIKLMISKGLKQKTYG